MVLKIDTVIPSLLITRQRALGLDSVDVNIILYLATRWWYAENPPFPAKATIAETLKLTPRTVQRHIAKLERRSLIKRQARYSREHGQEANVYNLAGLIAALTPYAQEEIDLREANKREQVEKPVRKRPRRLTLVKSEEKTK